MKDLLKLGRTIAVLSVAILAWGGIDQTTKDALKVKHILRTIERHPPRSDGRDRSAEVTEKELNAYIAHRLKQEKSAYINAITVNLMADNHVRGKISFNADQLKLSILLGEMLDFDFTGIFHTRNGAARLQLISLYLGGYPVKPQVLDYIIDTAARYSGTPMGSIEDWYQLPKGIKRIKVTHAKAIAYY